MMKRMLLLVVLALLASGIKAQDTLSLSLELVNPSGKSLHGFGLCVFVFV